MDVLQEIETLLGRQAVENLDFEALEIAVQKQVLQLAGRAVDNDAMRNLPCTRIQCDEIWSFCYAKDKNVHQTCVRL